MLVLSADNVNYGWQWVALETCPGVDLTGYSLTWGTDDEAFGPYDLLGVAGGDCVVVGGAQTGPANGSPSYHQIMGFNPPLPSEGAGGAYLMLHDDTDVVDAVAWGTDGSWPVPWGLLHPAVSWPAPGIEIQRGDGWALAGLDGGC